MRSCPGLYNSACSSTSNTLFLGYFRCISVCANQSLQSENPIIEKTGHPSICCPPIFLLSLFHFSSFLFAGSAVVSLHTASSPLSEGQPETSHTVVLLPKGSWEPVAQRPRLGNASSYHQLQELPGCRSSIVNIHRNLWVSNLFREDG